MISRFAFRATTGRPKPKRWMLAITSGTVARFFRSLALRFHGWSAEGGMFTAGGGALPSSTFAAAVARLGLTGAFRVRVAEESVAFASWPSSATGSAPPEPLAVVVVVSWVMGVALPVAPRPRLDDS
jgi:hypothetical protein